MSEEEFFNRLINKIDKEFGYDVANTLQLMFIKKEKQVEQLENIRKEAIEYINHATIGADSSPIEDSWLYNLYETKHILNKGDNNE